MARETSGDRPQADFVLSYEDMFLMGLPLLDERAAALRAAGRYAESAKVYAEDVERMRATVAAAESAGAVRETGSAAERSFNHRVSHGLRKRAEVEACLPRVRPALELSAEALEIVRGIEREAPEERYRVLLAETLFSFAVTRAFCRLQLTEAADAIAEALGILRDLAADSPDGYQAAIEHYSTIERAIGTLVERRSQPSDVGLPGSAFLTTDWRQSLSDGVRMHRLVKAKEASAMIEEAKDPYLAEAVCWVLDESGDAEGSRMLGVIFKGMGEIDLAEAAFRRADERGSLEAPFYLGVILHERGDLAEAEQNYRRALEHGSLLAAFNLGLILKDRGDVEGAQAAFERAATSEDAETAADAQRALKRLHRKARWPRRHS